MTASAKTTLYLRGMPRALVREAKAQAAREGVTLAHYVAERLSRATSSAAPGAESSAGKPEPATEAPPKKQPKKAGAERELEADLAWYEANRAAIEREHAGRYVAVIERKVVDHDAEFDPLARRVFEKYGTRSVCMPRVGRSVVRVRSPRRVAG